MTQLATHKNRYNVHSHVELSMINHLTTGHTIKPIPVKDKVYPQLGP